MGRPWHRQTWGYRKTLAQLTSVWILTQQLATLGLHQRSWASVLHVWNVLRLLPGGLSGNLFPCLSLRFLRYLILTRVSKVLASPSFNLESEFVLATPTPQLHPPVLTDYVMDWSKWQRLCVHPGVRSGSWRELYWDCGGESCWSNILRSTMRPSKRPKSLLPLLCISPFAHPFLLLLFRMRLKLESIEDRSQWGSEWVWEREKIKLEMELRLNGTLRRIQSELAST